MRNAEIQLCRRQTVPERSCLREDCPIGGSPNNADLWCWAMDTGQFQRRHNSGRGSTTVLCHSLDGDFQPRPECLVRYCAVLWSDRHRVRQDDFCQGERLCELDKRAGADESNARRYKDKGEDDGQHGWGQLRHKGDISSVFGAELVGG